MANNKDTAKTSSNDTASQTMDAGDFKNLRVQADQILLRDAPLGELLHEVIKHLGKAFGFDAAEEDAKEQARIDEAAQHLSDQNVGVVNDAGTRTMVNPTTSVVPGTPDADTNPLVQQTVKENLTTDDKQDQKNSEGKKG